MGGVSRVFSVLTHRFSTPDCAEEHSPRAHADHPEKPGVARSPGGGTDSPAKRRRRGSPQMCLESVWSFTEYPDSCRAWFTAFFFR